MFSHETLALFYYLIRFFNTRFLKTYNVIYEKQKFFNFALAYFHIHTREAQEYHKPYLSLRNHEYDIDKEKPLVFNKLKWNFVDLRPLRFAFLILIGRDTNG